MMRDEFIKSKSSEPLLFHNEECSNIVGIKNGDLMLLQCPSSKADMAIKKHHYSHKVTKNRFLSFSVNDEKGFLQLGYGIRPSSKGSIHPMITKDNYCEFDRMWLSDELPKFSESRVIGMLLRLLKKSHPKIVFIITYADESAGNKGIIYKATNAIAIPPVCVDFYLLPNGERLHPVSAWHRHKTRAWESMQRLYPGIKHIKGKFPDGPFQRRFLYIQNKWFRRRFLRESKELSVCVGTKQGT